MKTLPLVCLLVSAAPVIGADGGSIWTPEGIKVSSAPHDDASRNIGLAEIAVLRSKP